MFRSCLQPCKCHQVSLPEKLTQESYNHKHIGYFTWLIYAYCFMTLWHTTVLPLVCNCPITVHWLGPEEDGHFLRALYCTKAANRPASLHYYVDRECQFISMERVKIVSILLWAGAQSVHCNFNTCHCTTHHTTRYVSKYFIPVPFAVYESQGRELSENKASYVQYVPCVSKQVLRQTWISNTGAYRASRARAHVYTCNCAISKSQTWRLKYQ